MNIGQIRYFVAVYQAGSFSQAAKAQFITVQAVSKSIADLQGLARSLLLQDFTGGGVIFRHVHTLTVQTPEDLPWALDGEFDPGGAQVEIHNLHRRLTFLI